MAILEQDKVFYNTEDNGDKTIYLPITRANNVEGLGRSANTSYSVGDVVYTDNNMQVALKCTTAGTTSDSELDISTNVVGDSVADGGVAWSVVSRDTVVTIDKERPIKTFTSLEQLGLDNNTTIENIAFALPQGSLLCLVANVVDFPNMALPSVVNSGMLTVTNNNPYGNYVQFLWQQDDGILWSGSFSGYKPDSFAWHKLATNGALSMPSGNVIAVAYTSAFTTYYAPCDGWFCANSNASGSTFVALTNQSSGMTIYNSAHSASAFVPAKTGDRLTSEINMNGLSGNPYAFFVYAQSEV